MLLLIYYAIKKRIPTNILAGTPSLLSFIRFDKDSASFSVAQVLQSAIKHIKTVQTMQTALPRSLAYLDY